MIPLSAKSNLVSLSLYKCSNKIFLFMSVNTYNFCSVVSGVQTFNLHETQLWPKHLVTVLFFSLFLMFRQSVPRYLFNKEGRVYCNSPSHGSENSSGKQKDPPPTLTCRFNNKLININSTTLTYNNQNVYSHPRRA